MYDLIKELGLEAETLKWYHLSACKGIDINWYYDQYEADGTIRPVVDDICLSCPVAAMCFSEGVSNKERGVWGGVYLNLGRPDKDLNAHKTVEVKKKLEKIHGKPVV